MSDFDFRLDSGGQFYLYYEDGPRITDIDTGLSKKVWTRETCVKKVVALVESLPATELDKAIISQFWRKASDYVAPITPGEESSLEEWVRAASVSQLWDAWELINGVNL